MGKRREEKRRKARAAQAGDAGQAEGQPQSQQPYAQPADPPRAALAVHPAGAALALAVGTELRVFDARTGQHHTLVTEGGQQGSAAAAQQGGGAPGPPVIRGVAFDAAGRFLLAGSEEKACGMRLWDAQMWQLLQTIKVPKKVTAVAFTADGRHMLASDKFGDVLVAATQRPAGLAEGEQQETEVLLGHYCAIITSLSLSAGGRLLATTDRDQRVRVSIVPPDPMSAGAPEIQSLCFGHTAFVTCSAFAQRGGQELLVTGGGDGTLRLWDPLEGALLHTLELPKQEQQQQEPAEGEQQQQDEQQAAAEQAAEAAEEGEGGSGEEGEPSAACANGGAAAAPSGLPVPLALACSPCGRWVVAAVDGRDDLCLLTLDWEGKRLQEAGWSSLPGLHLPACLSFDASGRLWAAGGPVADDSTAAFLACGSIAEGEAAGGPRLVAAALPDWLPAAAAAGLEAKAGNEGDLLAAAAERRRLANQLLQKRKYDLQALEGRKKRRRDKQAGAEEEAAGEAAAE